VLKSAESKWARGHFHRGEGTFEPLPGPGDAPDLEAMFADPFGPVPAGHDGELDGQAAELEHDAPPAALRGEQAARGAGPVKAAVRRDIQAKISFALELPGQVWKARDPVCGGRFVEQRPAMAEAWTDVVCDSPDLVAWFTGPGGGFMKYLKVGAATWPVIETVLAHHVIHRGDQDGKAAGQQPQAPDLSRYAA
jgi:hypothetical protein